MKWNKRSSNEKENLRGWGWSWNRKENLHETRKKICMAGGIICWSSRWLTADLLKLRVGGGYGGSCQARTCLFHSTEIKRSHSCPALAASALKNIYKKSVFVSEVQSLYHGTPDWGNLKSFARAVHNLIIAVLNFHAFSSFLLRCSCCY